MSFFKRLVNISAYLFYTLAMLVLLLWYQFPGPAVKARIESELHRATPNLQWHVGSAGLALPAGLRLTDIGFSTLAEPKKTIFAADFLSLRPYFRSFLKDRKRSTRFRLGVLKGTVDGQLSLAPDGKTLHYKGRAAGIKISGLQKNMEKFNRSVTGTLSGSFMGKGKVGGPAALSLQGDFEILKGTVSLQEPVLGMAKLVFNQVSAKIKYLPKKIDLAGGRIDSRLLAGEFSGTVKTAGSLAGSTLKLNGTLIPRPEFLSGLDDAAAVKLLKGKLKRGKLPFAVNGTIEAPGIVFADLPADFNKQLQGGRR